MGNIPLIGSQLNQVDSAVIPSRQLLLRSGFTAWFLTEINHGSDKRTKIKSDLQLQTTQKGLHWKLVSQCNSQLVNDIGMLIYIATCKWELFFDLHHNAKIWGGGCEEKNWKAPNLKKIEAKICNQHWQRMEAELKGQGEKIKESNST